MSSPCISDVPQALIESRLQTATQRFSTRTCFDLLPPLNFTIALASDKTPDCCSNDRAEVPHISHHARIL